ncbi:MAG: DsbA family protein [Bacteroidales bacterium]|nr:DsbA family protein [Bacteroidales bacterium]
MEKHKADTGLVCDDMSCATHNINEKLAEAFSLDKDPLGKIMYFGDPMCSWCWGIANHLEKIKEHYKYKLNFELVLGGLRPGGGEKWDNNMKEMLRGHWKHVNEYSGQEFNYELLNRDFFNYDTEPPSRAVRIVRDLAAEKEFQFFKEVQRAFYVSNSDLNDIESYKSICKKTDIPYDDLKNAFESDLYKELVKKDFQKSSEYSIRGFPSVVIQIGDDNQLIARGYTSFDNMKVLIDRILSAVKK